MDRDAKLTKALENLSRTINAVIESSVDVREAVEALREIGFEPNLSMRLEIGLEALAEHSEEAEFDLDLTDDDVQALKRMKISV